jgi:hypothetical protein
MKLPQIQVTAKTQLHKAKSLIQHFQIQDLYQINRQQILQQAQQMTLLLILQQTHLIQPLSKQRKLMKQDLLLLIAALQIAVLLIALIQIVLRK